SPPQEPRASPPAPPSSPPPRRPGRQTATRRCPSFPPAAAERCGAPLPQRQTPSLHALISSPSRFSLFSLPLIKVRRVVQGPVVIEPLHRHLRVLGRRHHLGKIRPNFLQHRLPGLAKVLPVPVKHRRQAERLCIRIPLRTLPRVRQPRAHPRVELRLNAGSIERRLAKIRTADRS